MRSLLLVMLVAVLLPIDLVSQGVVARGTDAGALYTAQRTDVGALYAALQHARKDFPDGPFTLDARSRVGEDVLTEVARLLGAQIRRGNMARCEKRRDCRFLEGFVGALRVDSAARVTEDGFEAHVWTTVLMTTDLGSWMYGRKYAVKVAWRNDRWVVTSFEMMVQT